MESVESYIDQIREFNRFYTVLLGFLNQNYLASGYSVTETRLLFEIYRNPHISANKLIALLRLDKGYISRQIRSFEQQGLIERRVSEKDSRLRTIQLTAAGKTETERLISITNQDIRRLIAPLDDEARAEVCHAMGTIITYFSNQMEAETHE